MARFQAGNVSMDGTPGVRPKPPVQPTLSSGPAVPTKKLVLESSLSSGVTTTSIAPKPKSTVNTARSAPDMHDPPKLKAFGTRFENTQESNKVNFKVPVKPKPPDSSQDSETPKVLFPKVPLQKAPSSIMANDSKVTSPKPMAPMAKPPWVKDTPKAEDNSTSPNPTPPKMPLAPKPKSTIAMLRQQPEESSNVESAAKPSMVSNVKPSSFRVKNSFIKPDGGVKEGAKVPSANESGSKPVAPNKPNIPRKSSGPPVQTANVDPSAPKKKPLPNTYALGSAPAKPNRPPKVNLEKFKKGSEATTESEYCLSSTKCANFLYGSIWGNKTISSKHFISHIKATKTLYTKQPLLIHKHSRVDFGPKWFPWFCLWLLCFPLRPLASLHNIMSTIKP